MAARSKYRAVPVEIDGKRFASNREYRRYLELRLLERAGDISDLVLQPRIPIEINGEPVRYKSGRILTYVADFAYKRAGEKHIEDAKGVETPEFKIKRALVEHLYGFKVETV